MAEIAYQKRILLVSAAESANYSGMVEELMLSEITARQRREEEHARLLEALASKVEENTRLHAQLERVRSASVFVVCGITVLFLVACMAIWQLWPAGCGGR